MESQNDKKHFAENERKGIGKREELLHSEDDNLAFVPIENIRIIERVILNLEEVMLRLRSFRT